MCWQDIITITYGCGHVIVEPPKRHYCDNPTCKYSASHRRDHDCVATGCTENIYENKRGWPEPHQCYDCKEARLAAAGLTLDPQ